MHCTMNASNNFLKDVFMGDAQLRTRLCAMWHYPFIVQSRSLIATQPPEAIIANHPYKKSVLCFPDHWEAVQAFKYAGKGDSPYVNGVAYHFTINLLQSNLIEICNDQRVTVFMKGLSLYKALQRARCKTHCHFFSHLKIKNNIYARTCFSMGTACKSESFQLGYNLDDSQLTLSWHGVAPLPQDQDIFASVTKIDNGWGKHIDFSRLVERDRVAPPSLAKAIHHISLEELHTLGYHPGRCLDSSPLRPAPSTLLQDFIDLGHSLWNFTTSLAYRRQFMDLAPSPLRFVGKTPLPKCRFFMWLRLHRRLSKT